MLSLNGWNLTKFSKCVEIDEIDIVIVMRLITELVPLTPVRISFLFNTINLDC